MSEQTRYIGYICPVCGYTHEGPMTEACPVCKAPAKGFYKVD